MSESMKMLFSLSFSGTLLLLLLLLLKQLYKNKFCKCWQYYIWLVVAFRFLFPFTPDITVTGYLFEAMITETDAEHTSGTNHIPASPVDTLESPFVSPGNTAAGADTQQNPLEPDTCLFFVWSTISLVCIVRKITIYQSFIRYVRAGNAEVSDICTLNLLAECEEKLKVRKTIELCHNPLISSPIMTGLFRPCVILPAGQYAVEDLSYIFTHELIHYKRKDILYKWLIQFVICIHWFNPFIYLLGKEVNEACELSCDEAVISSLNDSEKKAYGDILLSSVKADNHCKNSFASVTLTEGARQLKERLGAIMNFKKKSRTITIVTAMITMMICICFSTLGAYAKPNGTSENNLGSTISHKETESVKNTEMYTYTQGGYYQNSFIIEMGFNIDEKYSDLYDSKNEIILTDNSKMTVYFADTAKEYAENVQALAAIGKLITSLKNADTPSAIEKPLIVSVTPTSGYDLTELAEEYFETDSLTKFSAIFTALDKTAQKDYCQRIYDTGKIAFFSSIIQDLDEDLILLYADKSEQDNKVTFFSVILDYIQPADLKRYTEKYYEADNIARFSILVSYMSKAEKQDWLIRAENDRKYTFYNVISDQLAE